MTFSRLQQQLNAVKCFRIESIPYRRRRQAPASWTAARQMPLPLHRFQKELLAFSVIDHVFLNVFCDFIIFIVALRDVFIKGRVAKFRHLHGTVMPRNTHLENFRGLDNALPTECNGFHGTFFYLLLLLLLKKKQSTKRKLTLFFFSFFLR